MNEIKAEIEESEDQDQVQDKYYADFISIGNTHEMNQLTVYADNVEDKKDSKNYISGNFTILLKTGIGAKKLSDLIITTQPKSIDNSTEKDKFPYLIVFLSAFGVIIISIVIAIVIFIFIRRNNQDDSSSGSIIESSSDVENPAVL
ncbi:hypothetical protein TVAG_385460 [Trichomonas vaginalis G3]|uniref:Uncharacterized protein n=1 Tax=Trichomonas vaginalis (strain ATCC PRA-98 / G3) TaxID=412133 RepID=A2GBW9_TRIV3|nr:hypothetical protein TVAGG3_0911830 [Trichomonas vaginalis G3]EAX85347.1 hypothetical protein TVAG_385460 [Trichomonas vaginalis G3]KAI5484482.1 hypothetical protein TVAGG3_0911830 [Trichomonas vaginalis G3]|eukprot:XP_001298277.1 hypothetical protein [Trichomonas vaginalis G3]